MYIYFGVEVRVKLRLGLNHFYVYYVFFKVSWTFEDSMGNTGTRYNRRHPNITSFLAEC